MISNTKTIEKELKSIIDEMMLGLADADKPVGIGIYIELEGFAGFAGHPIYGRKTR